MGVKGLYGLINCNPELLEPYFLHDETVVIDGWNIAFRLYLGSNLDCVYGGELLAYTDLVRRLVISFLMRGEKSVLVKWNSAV